MTSTRSNVLAACLNSISMSISSVSNAHITQATRDFDINMPALSVLFGNQRGLTGRAV